jgi:N-acetylglucosaminyldiphosphoundecaprenol N-acetyl-beta-D-mannosaminyltransferase
VTSLLGLDFADIELDGVTRILAARGEDAPFAYVVTPNADHLVRLHRDPERYGPLYRDAAWRLLDSRVVARLARAFGLSPPPVVTGSDLTARLFGQVIGPDDRIAVVGGSSATIASLRRRFGLGDLLHHDPPMGFETKPAAFAAAVDFVEAARARFAVLAVGSPRQEMLARSLMQRGHARGTALCVGASLLFLSGEERRAPAVVQRAGLEWAWRLAQDPQRMARRYVLDNPAIFSLLWRERSARGLQ